MEAIPMDVKRAMRSLQRMVHAVSGALQPGVEPKVRGTDRYRAIGDRHAMRDVYGRDGRVDIYSGREMVQYYMATSFGKNQPF
ncbi:MAG: hypothetical protein WCX13_05095 [Candidatus Hydrogenedentales bacterium]